MSDRVLITTDDLEQAVRINAALEQAGLDTATVSSLDDVRSAVRGREPDAIVLTGGLHESTAQRLLAAAREHAVSTLGLVEPTDDDPSRIANELGLTDWMVKPADPQEVAATVRRLIERRKLQQRTGILGESPAIQEVLVKIEQIAPVTSTVLIEGESGTGKELVARAIHDLSPRRGKAFIAVNVAGLPETLLESELFVHEKGAFTGAAERRLGRFELADGGTILLDEVSEAPLSTQVKLLRVLEQREVTRVGGSQPFTVDVRVLAATNRPLRDAVESGQFRADLYYRLNVLTIYLPPLRERREDIPLLVRRFVQEFSAQHDRAFHGISADAMQLLAEYPWPGNVRELRNLVESMVVLAPGREITAEDIPREIRAGGSARLLPLHVGPVVRGQEAAIGREVEFILRSLVELKLQMEELRRRVDDSRAMRELVGEVHAPPQVGGAVSAIEPRDQPPPPNVITITPGMTMQEIERAAIEAALKETRGNRRKAAEMLGIGERTLYRKLKEYNVPGVT